MILSNTDIEGVTFRGGEPFLQGLALAEVARIVRAADKSVIIFTGFEWGALQSSTDPAHQALLAQSDTLIAGPNRSDIPSAHHYPTRRS